MHTTGVEDHGHGSTVGHLSIKACDFSLDQVHKGFTLCADPTATGQYCQGAAHTFNFKKDMRAPSNSGVG